MAKLLIKQRVFSWTDTYDVFDFRGEPKYFVKADMFTIGHRIRIFSHETGYEVGMIQQRVLSLLGRADISVEGRMLGTIVRELSLFVPKYSIDYNGWRIEGDFLGWDYSIKDRYGNNVASISKELFHWGDTYAITAVNDEDELGVLITAIAIDMMNCSRNNN